MRLFIFVFVNAESTVDFATGLDIQPSFAIPADSLEAAIQRFVELYGDEETYSSDPDDIKADIDDGNISVEIPSFRGISLL